MMIKIFNITIYDSNLNQYFRQIKNQIIHKKIFEEFIFIVVRPLEKVSLVLDV